MAALRLFWDSVPNAASYTIYWSLTTGVTTSNGTPITGIDNVVYHHTGLLQNTAYHYIVLAVDDLGNQGPPSIEFGATTGT